MKKLWDKGTAEKIGKLSYLEKNIYFCEKNISYMENSKETLTKIVDKIRKLRKERGYSNEVMATDLEMSTSAYNKIECMKATLSLERFIKIREILDVPYSEFFESTFRNVYKQDLKDSSIGHYEVQTLNQENKETTQKLIQRFEQEIEHLRKEIVFLRNLVEKQ
ncbi:hypothetical protein FACS189429_8230 [Bacteroidia bacterium]|nr:hypothetical protein FACS189429_8230 [Bacteroidia bacterium]